jgi:hypothetical protein
VTLVEHAARELARTNEDPDVVAWYCRVVEAFSSFGHSGGSAAATIPVLFELLNYRPLTPLTDDPAEWLDRSVMTGRPLWQSVRHHSAFSTDAGRTYYLLDEDAGDGIAIASLHRTEPSGVSS